MGAEVGVLELQIHDNSAKAASGLGNLASALTRVQKALGSGLRLGNTANQIGKIVEKMQSAIPEESVSRIERLANAMEKLSAAGKISIPSLKGLKVDSVKEATNAAKENDPFESTASTVSAISERHEEIVEKVHEENEAVIKAREAMDTVKDSTEKAASEAAELSEEMTPAKETIQATKEEARQLKEELQSASSAAQKINTGNWKSFNPKTGMFEDDPSIKSVADLYAQIDQRRQEAEARGRENVIERLRKDFSNSPTNVQDTVLGFHGLTREEVFPSEVAEGAAELAGAAENAREALSDVQETGKDLGKTLNDTANNGTSKLREAFDNLKDSVSKMASPLSGLVGQLAKVARYRMLRAIIKQIAEGFKEGVENYYHYSEAVNNGFSAAMDRAATSMQTFKNSIGAAVAPLIQALIPILQQVVTWVVTAINYVNQFIALLSGKTTWSKAIDTTAKAFENTKKKAGGASKAIKKTDNAVKDLLADFDELNIIQSQTGDNGGSGSGGGGGGTGKTATDFKKMFTEVSKFDNGIKRLVDNLKKNFGSILNLATEIGAAVLAWKVSSAFSGVIAQAAGLLGSVVIMDIVFRLSKSFTSTFLDTGKEGWLLLSGLTPLVGGFIAKKLLTQIGLRGLASYSIPISLALGATATISAVVNDADVSTMDAKSIEALILAAIEAGGATGLALNSAGVLTAASSAGIGAAAALITFGVAIGLKESAMVLETGKITQESIVADIGSAAFVGAGLTLSHGVLGLSASSAASAGAAGGIITFGVLMGLQASLTLAENGEITEAKVWNALGIQAGSSLLIGAGAAILGLGALSSAGLAFASFGLFLALDAIITNNRPKKIMWGDSELTDEQIESWVNEKMFKVNVKATISKIETVVGNNKSTKDEIESGMSDVETNLGVIELGLADETTYDNLRKSLFGENGEGGVVGRLKQYASEQQVTIKTSMTLLPLLNENGEEDSQRTAEVMKAGLTGWKEVQDYMTDLGGKLSEALKAGSKAGLKGYDDELIQTLTEKLANVQRAVTGAQLSSAATGDLLTNLTGLSAGDAQGILDTYERYKEQLSEGYNKILQEELSSYQGLAAFYRARGEEGDETIAEYYEGLASELVKQWPERVARGIEEAGGEGKKIIAEKLSELFMLSPSDLTGRVYNDALQRSMAGALEISIRNSNMQNSSDVKDSMKQWLDSILKASLTEGDYNIVSGELSSGILKYTDLFSQETIDQLTSQWQGDNNQYKQVIQEAWQEMLADALGKKPKKIVAEEAEVEQTVVAETVVEQAEPEVSDEGGFDWSNYDFGAGNFEFELTDFHGAGTMAEWEDLWDAMFSNGTGTEAAANALRGRLDEIVEMAFLGTGQGSKILEALKNGDLNYGDVIQQSVLQSIEEALGLEYDSPEIQEKWNAILDEIFGGEYSPELEVDPEITGKTDGSQWATRAAQTASRASSGYMGDNSIWVNGALIREEQDRATEKENVQVGVSAGTFTMQQTLQTGMANRKSDIQNGVQTGTGSLLTALNSILSVAQAINNKQFTVNIVPSTTLGEVNKQSGRRLGRVTGNMEAPT